MPLEWLTARRGRVVRSTPQAMRTMSEADLLTWCVILLVERTTQGVVVVAARAHYSSITGRKYYGACSTPLDVVTEHISQVRLYGPART